MRSLILAAVVSLALVLVGCEKKSASPDSGKAPVGSPPPSAGSARKDTQTGNDHAGLAHEKEEAAGHHGAAIELGTAKVGSFEVRAARDVGEIKPGGDAPIDIWVNGGKGEGVAAVRFWIGIQDSKGSVKAKADIEDSHWHTHTEVPNPLPADAKLWVELESQDGAKTTVSFELKL